MSDSVWYSDALRQSQLSCGAHVLDEEGKTNAYVQAMNAMKMRGEAPGEDDLPDRFFWPYRDGQIEPPADGLFQLGGFLAVTESCADAMRPFNFGDGGLRPIRIFQNDREKALPDTYFVLAFGASKAAFDPEASNAKANMYAPDVWDVAIDPKDLDVAVTLAALKGPDLWIDPSISQGLFVSGALHKAVATAGFAENFFFSRCKISN